MARLVLLNGPPAGGKSTLARRYAEDHPGTLALDVDVVRGMLGRPLEDAQVSGQRARGLALAMAGDQLNAGYDVVVPQHLGRLPFVEELDRLARRTGAQFVEVMLTCPVEDTVSRFTARTRAALRAEHEDAAQLLSRAGGRAELVAMHERLDQVLQARPRTRLVAVRPDDILGTYALLLGVIGEDGCAPAHASGAS